MISKEHSLQIKAAIGNVHPVESECLDQLFGIAQYRKLKKYEFFSREGQNNKEFGFIIDGILRVFYLSEKGTEHNKHFLRTDDFIAASIHPGKKAITNIQALVATTLVSIDYNKFIALSD